MSFLTVMKAIFREKGQSDHFHKYIIDEQVQIGDIHPSDVKIQVKACGLSPVKKGHDFLRKAIELHIPVGHDVAGVVMETGSEVTMVTKGDKVVGVTPLNCIYSGCAEYCITSQYDVVKVPDGVNFVEAASIIGEGVHAYTALYYQAHVCGGDTCLVIDGATPSGAATIQLAQHWGAKVMATCSTAEEKLYLEKLQPPIAQIIDLGDKSNILVSSVMEETGGLGADIIVDTGVRLFTNEEDILTSAGHSKYATPTKHELISCLAAGGRWVTSQDDLQLDPPDSQLLFQKGGSISFLFSHIWALSGAQYGRYQHILQNVMQKLYEGILRPNVTAKVSLENAIDVLQTLPDKRIGKTVVQI